MLRLLKALFGGGEESGDSRTIASPYPPPVISISDAGECCVLQLADGRSVELNLSMKRLDQYLAQQEFPESAKLIEVRKIVAYPPQFRMQPDEWTSIAGILNRSDTFLSAVQDEPRIQAAISMPYSSLKQLPATLYGGVGYYLDGEGNATLYLSHPFDFWPDDHLGEGWYRKVIPGRRHRLIWTEVNLDSQELKLQVDVRPWEDVINESFE